MKFFSKKQMPVGEFPKFNVADAQLIMDRVKPLYMELEKMEIAQHIHGIGAMLDRQTHKPFVFIHLPLDFKIDLATLPQSYDDIEIRYEKKQYAVG
jgi:hypothetical protein